MATFLTQQQEVAAELRLDLTQADQATLVKRWINRAQKEIWDAEDWNFSADRQILQTVVDVTDGTVSVAAGGQTVTGVATPWSSDHIGSYIQFSTTNDWYKITAVASSLSLTIEAPYTQTTALSARTYTIRKMFYSLGSTVEAILDARQFITPSSIALVDYREFDIFRPNPTSTGDALMMIVFGQDSSNNLQVSLYPIADSIVNIEIRFKKKAVDLSADSDQSVIPDKWNETVMIDGALAQGHIYQSNGNAAMLQQAQAMFGKFKAGIERMKENDRPDTGKHSVMQSRDVLNIPYGPRLPYKYGV